MEDVAEDMRRQAAAALVLSCRGGSDNHYNHLYQHRLTDAAIEIERSRRIGSHVTAADGAESALQVPPRAPFVLRSILTTHPRPQAMIDAMTGAAGERVLPPQFYNTGEMLLSIVATRREAAEHAVCAAAAARREQLSQEPAHHR